MAFLNKFKKSLTKTRTGFVDKVTDILTLSKSIDEDLYEELEEALIQADVGVNTSLALIEKLRKNAKEQKIKESMQLLEIFKSLIAEIMSVNDNSMNLVPKGKNVILVVGVNGVGKTTTIGKLSYHYKNKGYGVMVAAGDTFRAAAIEQLNIWGDRVGVKVISQKESSDPGAVVFDACQALRSRKDDLLIIDTAGRLQNKTNLMEELKKITKIIKRELTDANLEVLLVLDGTTGQNGVMQAKVFNEVADITGICLTKLDGTAKGGMVIGISDELAIPVKFVGIGEGVEDLKPFDVQEFVEALFAKEMKEDE